MSDIFRFKCNSCGHVFDAPQATTNCAKCSAPLIKDNMGVIQIYRMGSPIGVAVGYGVYIDNQPYGHIANTQTSRIFVPMGNHTIHCTCGLTRKCEDIQVAVTPEAPITYVKARIKPGVFTNKIIVEQSKAEDMPAV